MNWVLALFAFAGLMTILSTIVYIIVEAVHKGLSLRKAGLAEMLRSLHDQVVRPIETGENTFVDALHKTPHSDQAKVFAKQIQQSPTYAGGNNWFSPSNWGINVNQRKFERLTQRQLAEQLAQTEFGRKLAESNRSDIEYAMARLGYEFDRFGEAQSAYFKRRAKVISGIVAFIFVVVANINVIDMYFHLAKDEDSLSRVIAGLNQTESGEFSLVADTMKASSEALRTKIESGELTGEAAVQAARDVKAFLNELDGGISLPIGRNYFPYCADPTVDAAHCMKSVVASDGSVTVEQTGMKGIMLYGGGSIPATPTISRLVNHWQTGLYWLFCMIASAGLLALGAPFWFDLFNKTAQLVGAMAAKGVLGSAPAQQTAPEKPKPYERTSGAGVKDMTDAFIIASGAPKWHYDANGDPVASDAPPPEIPVPANASDLEPADTAQAAPASLSPAPGYRIRMSDDPNPVMAKAYPEDEDLDEDDDEFRAHPHAPVVTASVPHSPAIGVAPEATAPTTNTSIRPIRGVQGNWKGKV